MRNYVSHWKTQILPQILFIYAYLFFIVLPFSVMDSKQRDADIGLVGIAVFLIYLVISSFGAAILWPVLCRLVLNKEQYQIVFNQQIRSQLNFKIPLISSLMYRWILFVSPKKKRAAAQRWLQYENPVVSPDDEAELYRRFGHDVAQRIVSALTLIQFLKEVGPTTVKTTYLFPDLAEVTNGLIYEDIPRIQHYIQDLVDDFEAGKIDVDDSGNVISPWRPRHVDDLRQFLLSDYSEKTFSQLYELGHVWDMSFALAQPLQDSAASAQLPGKREVQVSKFLRNWDKVFREIGIDPRHYKDLQREAYFFLRSCVLQSEFKLLKRFSMLQDKIDAKIKVFESDDRFKPYFQAAKVRKKLRRSMKIYGIVATAILLMAMIAPLGLLIYISVPR